MGSLAGVYSPQLIVGGDFNVVRNVAEREGRLGVGSGGDQVSTLHD